MDVIKNNLIGLKQYLKDKKNKSFDINLIRDILNQCLYYNELGDVRPFDILDIIYSTFIDRYIYRGIVYRGISSNLEYVHNVDNKLYSFSSNIDVADNFALKDDKNYAYRITQYITDGFNFGEFLNDLVDNEILLISDIEPFLGEDEILCRYTVNCEVVKI